MSAGTAVIVNPSASDWGVERKWPALARTFEKYGVRFDRMETKPGEDARPVARKAAESGYERIVVVGGDGTINAAVNGIMSAGAASRPKLALVPFGTANDISRSFNVPEGNIDECVKAMVEGIDYPLDLGLVDGERYFADAFTLGFDARVLDDRNLTRGSRLLMRKGIVSYVPSLFKEFLFFKKTMADMNLDGRHVRAKIFNLVVKNTRTYAGRFVLNRRIRANDGKLDVFLFRRGMEYWSEIGTQITKQVSQAADPFNVSEGIVDLIVRNHEDFQAGDVSIDLWRDLPSQADGDGYRVGSRFKVQCVKGAVTLQVPFPY